MIFILRQNREPHGFPADHRSESRLSIPQPGALQQSSSPLPQPSSIFNWTAEVCREIFSERRVSNTPSVSQLGCTAFRLITDEFRQVGDTPVSQLVIFNNQGA